MLLSHLPLKCLVVHGECILWHSLGFNALCVPCSILPGILCGLSLMSVHALLQGIFYGHSGYQLFPKPSISKFQFDQGRARVKTWINLDILISIGRIYNLGHKLLEHLPFCVLHFVKPTIYWRFRKMRKEARKKDPPPPGNVERKWSHYED